VAGDLKLRATLTRVGMTNLSPKLYEWQVGWTPHMYQAYLPMMLKKAP
jgi:hypothetical protein